MASDPSALLVVDIGTLFTNVVLIDQVAGDYRAVAQAQALSTLELPEADAWIGIQAALKKIEALTARQLISEYGPLTPHRPDGSGVDLAVFISSAAGALPVVLAAISQDTTGASLQRVAQSTYATLLGTVTLDEQRDQILPEGESWIDHQLTQLARLPAATVLLAGGTEGGNVTPVERLAHMLGFTLLRRDQSTNREFAHLLFSGNSAAYPIVEEALSTIVPITVAANVRPDLETEQLMPARYELMRIYNDKVLPNLPGYNRLRSMTTVPLRTTAECLLPITRFLSRHTERAVLVLDVGALSTALVYAHEHEQKQALAILANCGTGYGAAGILDQAGTSGISRWLPFTQTEQQVRERVLNILLRPQIVPITQEDLFFSQALAREALKIGMEALHDEQPELLFDFVIASGGSLTHVAHPAEALLMVLDALPEAAAASPMITDIYLDREMLLPLCGALGWQHPEAAYCVLEQDALRTGMLASCIVINDPGRAGEIAVEAVLTPVGGEPQTIQVRQGEIRNLELPRGQRGTLVLRPARTVRIGDNEPGAEVQSDIAALEGSILGVVIDARGRPLQLSADPAVRRTQIWGWMAQLGAVPSTNPYQISEPMSVEPVHMIAPEAPPEDEPQPTTKPVITADMPEWLRQDLEQEGLVQPPPTEFGIEEVPSWMLDAPDDHDTPDGVVDLGERSQPSNPADFSDLRAELEQNKSRKGWFRRK